MSFHGLYNGSYAAPLLRVQPGDMVRLTLANDSTLATNVHYHGLTRDAARHRRQRLPRVIPGSDGSLSYDFPIPADHPQGLFWYHPHVHPNVNRADRRRALRRHDRRRRPRAVPRASPGIPERVMLLKDLKIQRRAPVEDPDPTGPTTRTINGLFQPTHRHPAAASSQFWRIGNIGANIYYKLRLDGHRFYVIAQDGNLKNQVVETRRAAHPAGGALRGAGPRRPARQVQAAARMPFNTGPAGDHYPAQLLATLVSRGPAVTRAPAADELPAGPGPPPGRRSRGQRIDRLRRRTTATTRRQFTINGQVRTTTTASTRS